MTGDEDVNLAHALVQTTKAACASRIIRSRD